MAILISGGAGYIGSHMVLAALDRGDEVVVLDNLSSGIRSLVAEGAHFRGSVDMQRKGGTAPAKGEAKVTKPKPKARRSSMSASAAPSVPRVGASSEPVNNRCGKGSGTVWRTAAVAPSPIVTCSV